MSFSKHVICSLLLCLAGAPCLAGAAEDWIKPYEKNPRFWQYKGKPVLLLGGSKDDNLFQIPELKKHLDEMQAVGANYIRNTMSDRHDKGFEVYPFRRMGDGEYDLALWNDEYWKRFENMLKWTHQRDIIVQIELWDRFDYSDSHGSTRWQKHPYNPKNNVNYTAAESGFKKTYRKHPGSNEQPFFFTVPKLHNNRKVLRFQEGQVDKMLNYTLQYGHVLYCMDNETSGRPEWGAYWSNFIRKRAKAAKVEVHTTEMWDQWNPTHPTHRQTYDHPELYSFVDVSQNNHNKGQKHWDRLQWVRNYLSKAPRPMNTVKIYGADGGRFGNDKDARERFWRNITGGAAATRFHRPDSGIGLNSQAKANIRSMRLLLAELDIFNCTPDAGGKLLGSREDGEAFATSNDHQYAVYFPEGGAVNLDLTGTRGEFVVKWLNIAASKWLEPVEVRGGELIDLKAPGNGQWAVLVSAGK